MCLGLPPHRIEEIQIRYPGSVSQCLHASIQLWIEQSYNTKRFGLPSWKTLCEAISRVGDMKVLVRNLAKKHPGIHII